MNFIFRFFIGILIGAGAILPGISSGVFCVIFGIYENLINSIVIFFEKPIKNFKYLFPLFIGGIIGVLILGKILNLLLYTYPLQTKSVFIGLILGCFPSLLKNINTSKNFFKSKNIFFTIFTFILAIITIFIEKNLSFTTYTNFNNIYLIFSGFLMSIGIVIPGVSSTVILMLLGIYKFYLMAISNIYFPILIPMAIGIILGSIIFIKLINYLFNKYYFQTFYSIIGFSFGSILVLIPELNNFIEYIIFLLCVYLGFLISSSISKT